MTIKKLTIFLLTILPIKGYGQLYKLIYVDSIVINNDQNNIGRNKICTLNLIRKGNAILQAIHLDTMTKFAFFIDSLTDIRLDFSNDTFLIVRGYNYFLDSVIYNWIIGLKSNPECLYIDFQTDLTMSVTETVPYKKGVDYNNCLRSNSIFFGIEDSYKVQSKVKKYHYLN